MCCFRVLADEMPNTLVPSYCEDDMAWSASTLHKNITCANYLPEANWSTRRSCYKDHMEHPDIVFDVATHLYHNTRGLDVCNRCCRTCYDECCLFHNECPHSAVGGDLSVSTAVSVSTTSTAVSLSSSRRTLVSDSTTTERTLFHNCDQRYDCVREEYVLLAQPTLYHDCHLRYDCERKEYMPIITRPQLNSTLHNRLAVMLQVRIPVSLALFGIDERLSVREAVSRIFRVPIFLVVIGSVTEKEDFLNTSVSIGLISPTACVLVECEEVHIKLWQGLLSEEVFSQGLLSQGLFPDLPGASLLQPPLCQMCQAEDEFVFAKAGTVDDAFSCGRECGAGFFQFRGLDTATCEAHSTPHCSSTQFLLLGTSSSDSSCVNCSACQGERFVAPCLPHRDTVCESCPEPVARQYWTGNECSPACESGFVWDTRKLECEFCARALCEPGLLAPSLRDNCSHCVQCPPHPAHAHWSAQNDRFDCMWLCDDEYELSALQCVTTRSIAVDSLVQLQPVCKPGNIAVNFRCVSCFEAATTGVVMVHDLPQPADVDIKWQWFYGCQWRCMHAAGYWELRPENGMYWECTSSKLHTVMLRGVDMSWAAVKDNTSSNTGVRRQASSERGTLFTIFLFLVAVPVLVLVGMVIVGIAQLRGGETATSQENEALLSVYV